MDRIHGAVKLKDAKFASFSMLITAEKMCIYAVLQKSSTSYAYEL